MRGLRTLELRDVTLEGEASKVFEEEVLVHLEPPESDLRGGEELHFGVFFFIKFVFEVDVELGQEFCNVLLLFFAHRVTHFNVSVLKLVDKVELLECAEDAAREGAEARAEFHDVHFLPRPQILIKHPNMLEGVNQPNCKNLEEEKWVPR